MNKRDYLFRRRFEIPRSGCIWYHVIIATRGTWLPGDPRGFRNSFHRIHSSGDYKNPPPVGEHQKLNEYFKKIAAHEVTIPFELREIVGMAMLRSLQLHDNRCLAMAVAKTHAHLLLECVNSRIEIKKLASRLKQVSSRSVNGMLPGVLWARGGDYNPAEDKNYQQKVYYYILNHGKKEKTWVWNFRDCV